MGQQCRFPRLFSPMQIGRLTIPNRIVMPALNLVYCHDGSVNDRLINFYARRANGGVGLIIVGGCAVEHRGTSKGMIMLDSPQRLPGLRKLTEAIHEAGSLAAAQLFHAGGYAKPEVIGGAGAAPSEVYFRYSSHIPEAMSREQILETVCNFARAASLAKQSGFDAVELSASAGYLISEFLSLQTNHRATKFAKTTENRFRFAGLVVDFIRAVVGDEFPVIVRISGNDFMPGGNTVEQAKEFACFLEEKGVNAIDVTGGWHETGVPQLTGHLPPGGLAYLSAEIKDAVSLPVFASNRINDPTLAERIVALNIADAVCMGRQLICDPDTPIKAQMAKEKEIVPCIACGQGCTDHTFAGRPLNCILNPFAGMEDSLCWRPARETKRIAVIGAGASGMAAAIVAAKRGHKVDLYEREKQLGGCLRNLKMFASKRDCGRFLKRLTGCVSDSGVRVHCGCEIAGNETMFEDADIVVVATGSVIAYPENRGFQGELCTVEQMVHRQRILDKRVAVLGGTGLEWECAVWLAQDAELSPENERFLRRYQAETPEYLTRMSNSCGREITVISSGEKVAAGIGIGSRWIIKKELSRYGVKNICAVKRAVLVPDGVLVTNQDETTAKIETECVVLAGYERNNALFKRLKENGRTVQCIGSAVHPAAKGYVIHEAVKWALTI